MKGRDGKSQRRKSEEKVIEEKSIEKHNRREGHKKADQRRQSQRKKMMARAKVGKSLTLCFPRICGSGGAKSRIAGSLKQRVRSQLAR